MDELDNTEKVETEPKKKLKLKKTWRNKFTSPSGVILTEVYCRRCITYKNPKDFQASYDSFLDKSGMMSICRSCCEEIYQDNLRSEKDISKALLKTCRTLNWVFYAPAIEPAIEKYRASKEKNPDGKISFIGSYWTVVNGTNNMKYSEIPSLTFTEPLKEDFIPKEFIDDGEINEEIIKFWGEGFEKEEYKVLQQNYLDFKKDYTVEAKGAVLIVREICFKILELEKTRKIPGSSESILKEIQTLMKNGALTPAMANMANSGQARDTWGVRIATIQKNEPAEWLDQEEQKKKLKNYYGDFEYFKNFYVRSLKNYILGSKDYLSEELLSNNDEEELNIEELIIEEDEDVTEEKSSSIREE
jgi:hypothetical protein